MSSQSHPRVGEPLKRKTFRAQRSFRACNAAGSSSRGGRAAAIGRSTSISSLDTQLAQVRGRAQQKSCRIGANPLVLRKTTLPCWCTGVTTSIISHLANSWSQIERMHGIRGGHGSSVLCHKGRPSFTGPKTHGHTMWQMIRHHRRKIPSARSQRTERNLTSACGAWCRARGDHTRMSSAGVSAMPLVFCAISRSAS